MREVRGRRDGAREGVRAESMRGAGRGCRRGRGGGWRGHRGRTKRHMKKTNESQEHKTRTFGRKPGGGREARRAGTTENGDDSPGDDRGCKHGPERGRWGVLRGVKGVHIQGEEGGWRVTRARGGGRMRKGTQGEERGNHYQRCRQAPRADCCTALLLLLLTTTGEDRRDG